MENVLHWLKAALKGEKRFETVAIVWIVLIILGIWAFAEIADEVMEGDIQQFDEWVITSLRQEADPSLPKGPEWVLNIARDITALGGFTVLTLIILVVMGLLMMYRRFGAMWLVLSAAVLGTLLSHYLKTFFTRERPDVVPHLVTVSTASFPSGHAMLSTVIYLTLGVLLARILGERKLKIYIISVAVFLSILIGLSRVYLGVHYPSDVLAGWSVGTTWALLCLLVAHYLQRKGAVEEPVNEEDEHHYEGESESYPTSG